LAHKGRTDALHVCSSWRRILATLDTIIRAAKKVNIHKRFWLSTLVFFRLARRTNILKGRIATRRAPRRGFLFRQVASGWSSNAPRFVASCRLHRSVLGPRFVALGLAKSERCDPEGFECRPCYWKFNWSFHQ